MTVATVPLTDTFDQWRIKFNEVVVNQNAQIGDVIRATLITTATDIVPAINELKTLLNALDPADFLLKAGDTMEGDLTFDPSVDLILSATSTIINSTAEILLDEGGVGPSQVPLDSHVNGTNDSVLGFDSGGNPEYVLLSTLGADEYTDLTDTPANFSGDAYKVARVSGASNAIVHAGTGAVLVDAGTTGQRPGSPVNGMIRYNSSDNNLESFENGVWGQLGGGIFTSQFVSTPQVIVLNAVDTIAHGLGAIPEVIDVYIVCQTAEFGWSIGDFIYVNFPNISNDTSPPDTTSNFNAGADVTNAYIKIGADNLVYFNRGTGALVVLTPVNWKYVIKAII